MDSSQGSTNVPLQDDTYRQEEQRYIEAYRPQRPHNSDLYQVVNNPALNIAFSSSTHWNHGLGPSNAGNGTCTTHLPLPSLPPLPLALSSNFNSGSTNLNQLTPTNLEEYERRRLWRNPLRRFEYEDERAGPYDAIGEIRRDGRVYEEPLEHEEYQEHTSYDVGHDISH